jgi:hypothetical protein
MSEARLTLTSAQSQPFNCLISLKVGSTFLRNLIWVLDHGKPFSANEKAFPQDLPTCTLTQEELAQEVSFYVVRDPIARFFSLYFDKVAGKPENRFHFVTDKLIEHRIYHDGETLTPDQHRENCMSLLGFLSVRLRGMLKGSINPHWNKQITRLTPAIKFGLKPLMLEKLEPQLLQISDGRIDGLEAALAMVSSRNRSPRPISQDEVITPEIYQKICSLYPEDIQLYDLVKTGWELLGHPPEFEL